MLSPHQSPFPAINEARLKATLCSLLNIRSENPFDNTPCKGFREVEVGNYLAEQLDELGFQVEITEIVPDRINVVGRLRGKKHKPCLMLAGHLDTAPSDNWEQAYHIEERDGKIFGRGACDMKAALAAYLEVARLIRESGKRPQGDLIIAGICDEEYQMIGSRYLGKHGPHADFGIIGEPSNLAVCPANRGHLGCIIETFGKSVHSSVQEKGTNAICHMAKIIEVFSGYNDYLQQFTHPLLGSPSFSIGTIAGGTMLSTVPDYCCIEVDRRFLPDESVDTIYGQYHALIEPLARTIPDFRYKISKPTWNIPANDVDMENPVIQALLQSCQKLLHKTVVPQPFVAGSDAPHLGFPTVICGPGDLKQAHSSLEFVSTEQLTGAVWIYLNTIARLLY